MVHQPGICVSDECDETSGDKTDVGNDDTSLIDLMAVDSRCGISFFRQFGSFASLQPSRFHRAY